MLMSKKRWEGEKERNANCSGRAEGGGEKMETEEKVWERQQWRRKSEKEEQENSFPEKSHLTRNRPNKYATWNICLLFMTALYIRYHYL